MPQVPRGYGIGLEIAYYGAFLCHVANISTPQSTYTIYTLNEL